MDIRNYFAKKSDKSSPKRNVVKNQTKVESPDEFENIQKSKKRRVSRILSSDETDDIVPPKKVPQKPVKKIIKANNTKKTKASKTKKNSALISTDIKPSDSQDIKQDKKATQSDDFESPKKINPAKKLPKSNKIEPEETPTAAVSRTQNYRTLLAREPPTQLGTKILPLASDNCLEGKTFVLSGVLESFTREDMERCIKRYGGRITGSISGKTDYLLYGRDCGVTKLQKAKDIGTKTIGEDGLITILKSHPPSKSKTPQNEDFTKLSSVGTAPFTEKALVVPIGRTPSRLSVSADLLVDRYRPKKLSDLIGQQGPSSPANKLLKWLQNWRNSLNGLSSVEGGNFKAALLSGPPGLGKTTTAQLVCKELNMSYIELNASDCRSKKLIAGSLKMSMSSRSIVDSFAGKTLDKCLIMDEVDGMAGNEDRGGIAELIACIKMSVNPIICICNNRTEQKIRTLRNHCFELIFSRPRVEKLKEAMTKILEQEKIPMALNSLDLLIDSANRDIRLIINTISLWSTDATLTYDDVLEKSKNSHKDIEIEIFEACTRAFSQNFKVGKSMNDRLCNFFVDYSLMPLFMFENYPGLVVSGRKGANDDIIGRFARAGDAFCTADVMDAQIRGPNPSWELLPYMGFWSTIVPPLEIGGSLNTRLNFPAWFGRYSTRNKNRRLLDELHFHSRTRIPTVSPSVLLMDRLSVLRKIILQKLGKNAKNDDIRTVGDLLNYYYLQKEDMETIFALCDFGKSALSSVPTTVKSALTRLRKKDHVLMPYFMETGVRKKKRKRIVMSNEESEDSSGSSFDAVPIVKPKPKPAAAKKRVKK